MDSYDSNGEDLWNDDMTLMTAAQVVIKQHGNMQFIVW